MEVSEISDYFVATLLIFFCHVCKHTAETVDECQRIFSFGILLSFGYVGCFKN